MTVTVLCSGMREVVPARTSSTLLPHPLALCCNYPVSKCPSSSIVVTSTVRVNEAWHINNTKFTKQVSEVYRKQHVETLLCASDSDRQSVFNNAQRLHARLPLCTSMHEKENIAHKQ